MKTLKQIVTEAIEKDAILNQRFKNDPVLYYFFYCFLYLFTFIFLIIYEIQTFQRFGLRYKIYYSFLFSHIRSLWYKFRLYCLGFYFDKQGRKK